MLVLVATGRVGLVKKMYGGGDVPPAIVRLMAPVFCPETEVVGQVGCVRVEVSVRADGSKNETEIVPEQPSPSTALSKYVPALNRSISRSRLSVVVVDVLTGIPLLLTV